MDPSFNPPQTNSTPPPQTGGSIPAAPQPQQPAQPHVKQAHRFLMFYIFLIVTVLISGVIYAWQSNQVKNQKAQLVAANAQVANLKKQLTAALASLPTDTNAGNAPNNPYAGQKTFCDNFSPACLRYPQDWSIAGTTSSSKTTETITNPTSSVVVTYTSPFTSDNQVQVYFINSIEDLTLKTLGQKIVGRVLGTVPDYVMVDASYLTTNNVSAGKSVSFVSNPSYTSNNPKITDQLKAAPTTAALANIKSSAQATAWFGSNDAKAALKILQSLYYQ